MSLPQLLQYLLSGVTIGSIYAIVAIGFNIIYSTTGILNFAQGEFVMLGGMTAVTLHRGLNLPLPVAVTGAVAVVAACGAALELAFFRRLRGHSVLNLIIITIGLSIVIQEAALHLWDEMPRSLPCFSGDECSSVGVLGARITPQVLWVLGTTAVAVLALHGFLRGTLTGKAMRACSSNADAAALAGINIAGMRTLAFAMSAGLGALAGCVISPMAMSKYDMGAGLAIKGFAGAILGGLGNPMGAVAGGLLVGCAESLYVLLGDLARAVGGPGFALPSAYKDAVALAILVLALVARPQGLFGSRPGGGVREC